MNRLLHPLSYIALCIFYSSLAISLDIPQILAFVLVLAWVIDFREGFKTLLWKLDQLERIFWLIISIVIIQLLFRRGGDTMISLGAFKIYREAVYSAAFLSLRIMIIFMCAISLSRVDFSRYRSAFAAIRLPEELSFMVSYMAHLVPGYSARFKEQMQELKDRGINIRRLRFKDKLTLYKILALSAIADIILQSGRQAIALELRGFRSKGRPSSLYKHRFAWWDISIILWMLGLILLIWFLRATWFKNCTICLTI